MTDTLLQANFIRAKQIAYANKSSVRQKFNRNNKLASIQIYKSVRRQKRLTDFYNLMALLSNGILDDDAKPSQQIIALSDYLNLEHNNDLPSLTQAWEKFFLRNAITGHAIERWHLESLGLGQEWEQKRNSIVKLLQDTDLLASKYPRKNQYDTLIIHGARIEDIMPRLQFISEFWTNGGRFKNILVLTGERLLTADELNQNNWSFVPYRQTHKNDFSTEIALMQYAWQVNNIIPAAVRMLPIEWINTPNFTNEHGEVRRGNTENTINAWINWQLANEQYDLGNCLAVANAPLILRQHVVFERKLYERGINTSIETVGLAEAEIGSKNCIYYLREIAGLLWELNKLSKQVS